MMGRVLALVCEAATPSAAPTKTAPWAAASPARTKLSAADVARRIDMVFVYTLKELTPEPEKFLSN